MHEDIRAFAGLVSKVLIGCLVLVTVILGKSFADDWNVKTNWETTAGVVTDISAYTEKRSSMIYNGAAVVPTTVRDDIIQVQYMYTVGGTEYTGVGKLKWSLSEGAEITISYNPKNPAQSTIKSW